MNAILRSIGLFRLQANQIGLVADDGVTFLQDDTATFILVDDNPPGATSSGTPYEVFFDGAGNLFVCYAPNQWAMYTNTAPF
jgi:hypothetical protein